MDEPFDRNLAGLFDQKHEPLQPTDFSLAVERRVEHVRRRRRFWHAVALIDVLVAALIVTPYVMDGSAAMAAYLSSAVASLGNAMLSPIGIGCSLAFSAWFLRRIRRMAA